MQVLKNNWLLILSILISIGAAIYLKPKQVVIEDGANVGTINFKDSIPEVVQDSILSDTL